MKYFAIALASAALTGAQTPAVSIQPHLAGPGLLAPASHAGVPVLGYFAGPGALDLRAIVGSGKSARLGGVVVAPAGLKRLFLPPREHYTLVESNSATPLALWLPGDTESKSFGGGIAHPNTVVFSARGDAALVYSKESDQLEAISGLPAEPHVVSLPGLAGHGEAVAFAVSDDGAMAVAAFADGTAALSANGGAWRNLPAADGTQIFLFVPRTHNLIVCDALQQTLSLVANLGEPTQSARIVANNIAAGKLAFNKEGTALLAASSAENRFWTIDLKTMTVGAAVSAQVDAFFPLRDGHTFLLSATQLSLLSVTAESELVAGFVPVAR